MGLLLSLRGSGLVLALGLAFLVAPKAGGAGALDADQQDGYLIWLHSLEATIAARDAGGLPEPRRLFPHGLDPGDAGLADAMLDVARALEDLESRPRLLQEPAARSPLHALSRARNYAHLAEYDSSLVWYAAAARRDTAGDLAHELGLETMAAAIAGASRPVIEARLRELRRAADLGAHDQELELAYRYLIAAQDTVALRALVDLPAAAAPELPGRLRYWRAFALNWLGRWPDSLALLKDMIAADGVSHGLDESQRAWVLVAIPDQLLLLGERDAAAGLYRALGASAIPEAAVWAACQAAALDLLAGRYLKAGTALERLCRQSADTTWRGYACRLARLSDELHRLREEGRPHGAAVHYQP